MLAIPIINGKVLIDQKVMFLMGWIQFTHFLTTLIILSKTIELQSLKF